MQKIRVLHVLGGLGLGGAESRIMDMYRNIDREQIQFDFLIHTTEKGHYYEEVKKLGGNVYSVPRFKIYNYFTYKKKLKEFFSKHNEIQAVQGHMTSTASIYLPIARKSGIPMTIAHARSAGVDQGIKGRITKLLRRNLKNKTDYCFTCSALAGEAVFGKEAMEEGRVHIIPNAIEAGKYVYHKAVRQEIRKELKIEGKFVVGHVGRFNFMKNHEFLLDIFAEIIKQKPDSVLMLLGAGEGMEAMKTKAQQLGILDKVLFMGNKSNVSEYYQAMDFFVFPSIFEGLPGTVVEAQAAGLKCLISDSITGEVAFSELVKAFSLKQTPKEWADYVVKNCDYERTDTLEMVQNAGFDVKTQVEKMTAFYQTAEKKKLMLLVPMLHQGGFERVCVLTARLLQPFYQVFICVFDMTDLAYDIEGIPIIHLNLGVKPGKIGKAANVFKRCLAVAKWKKRLDIDVAYSFGPTANLVNVLSKSRGKTWCGIRSYMDMGSPKMLKLFTDRADKVISCSRIMEKELEKLYSCKDIDTLYNPYNHEFIKKQAMEPVSDLPWNPKEVDILVSMGREDDVKGFWHFLKSFALLQKNRPDSRLLIIGEGEFQEYKKLAEELGIREKVHFTGVKKNPFPYLAAGKVYVLTSYNEGFPNALVEAMSLGIPVISTNCMTGPAEILLEQFEEQVQSKEAIWADYGVLVPNMSPEKNLDPNVLEEDEKNLAVIMEKLLSDLELYNKYAKRAKERSAYFSYEKYVEKLQGYIG